MHSGTEHQEVILDPLQYKVTGTQEFNIQILKSDVCRDKGPIHKSESQDTRHTFTHFISLSAYRYL